MPISQIKKEMDCSKFKGNFLTVLGLQLECLYVQASTLPLSSTLLIPKRILELELEFRNVDTHEQGVEECEEYVQCW